MGKITVHFGYNTDTKREHYAAWENVGTKYNFNIAGIVLGVFKNNDQQILLSQIVNSFGDNCMVGTIDAREIVIKNYMNDHIILSNNAPSETCMNIARLLSQKELIQELSEGKNIEQTNGFELLKKLNIDLKRQDIVLDDDVIICGIEPEKFEQFKKVEKDKTR